jgi:hypothetical protein
MQGSRPGTFRSEVLNAYIFESLDEVREMACWWMNLYNEERPHEALGGLPPSLLPKPLNPQSSTLKILRFKGNLKICSVTSSATKSALYFDQHF